MGTFTVIPKTATRDKKSIDTNASTELELKGFESASQGDFVKKGATNIEFGGAPRGFSHASDDPKTSGAMSGGATHDCGMENGYDWTAQFDCKILSMAIAGSGWNANSELELLDDSVEVDSFQFTGSGTHFYEPTSPPTIAEGSNYEYRFRHGSGAAQFVYIYMLFAEVSEA